MSYIDTVALDEAEGDVRDMYERQQGAWGYVPNYAKSFSHRPEVMARWGRLLAEIRRPLSDRTFELVTTAAALELKHTPCALAHGSSLKPFFSNDDIKAIARQQPVESLTDAEQEMLRFARMIAKDASSITAEDVDRLKQNGLSDADVLDVALTAAARCFFTKVLDAVGSLPDAGFSAIDADLREVLTVGKPIDTADCEVMNDISD